MRQTTKSPEAVVPDRMNTGYEPSLPSAIDQPGAGLEQDRITPGINAPSKGYHKQPNT